MKLEWDKVSERKYETGVSKGVLYLAESGTYPKGVAWNGLTGVTESPSGAEASPLYADNIKYLNLMSNEDFGATIEAYSSPEEFDACDGSAALGKGVMAGQQKRSTFGFSYQSKIGNDVDGADFGYKIHLVYGCLAAPSERSRATVNESPEAMTLSWTVTTTPVDVPGLKPTAHISIDSTKANPAKLAELEKILYGDTDTEPRLPLPTELATLFAEG